MARTQEAIGEDPLEEEYRKLEEYWSSYKQSMPRRRRRRSPACFSAPLATHIAPDLPLFFCSPKKLVASLQGPARDLSSAAASSGKLRGRNLLEALESAKDDVSPNTKEEIMCGVCSSVLIQEGGGEARKFSSSSCSALGFSSSLSSSASLSGEDWEEEEEEEEVLSSGRRWSVRMVRTSFRLLVWALVLAVVAVTFGREEHGEYVIPT